MWFMFIMEGKWYERKNWALSVANILCFIVGVVVLAVGTYSSIKDIVSSICKHLQSFCIGILSWARLLA